MVSGKSGVQKQSEKVTPLTPSASQKAAEKSPPIQPGQRAEEHGEHPGTDQHAHGITLTAARHVVFVEPDWRGTYLEQAEDRAHRIGQTQPVLVTYLLLDQSAWSTDSWMDTKAKAKQAVIDAVLGSPGEKNSIR